MSQSITINSIGICQVSFFVLTRSRNALPSHSQTYYAQSLMFTMGNVLEELILVYLNAAQSLDPTLELAPHQQIHRKCTSDVRKGIQLLKEAQQIYAFSIHDFGQSRKEELKNSFDALLEALERAQKCLRKVYRSDVSLSTKIIEDCLVKPFKGTQDTKLSKALVELGLLNQFMDHFKIQMHVLESAIKGMARK